LGTAVLRRRIRRLARPDRVTAADPGRTFGARGGANDRGTLGRRPMDVSEVVGIIIGLVLWSLGAALVLTSAWRSKALAREGLWEGAHDFVILIPRVLIGVVGSGYIAAVMPPDLIAAWIGPNSGFAGITIATLVGAATPGG